MKRSLLSVLIGVSLGQLFFLHCAKQTVNSIWADETMKIDGEIGEWQAAMMYDEKLDASYGFQNNGDYFYVALETGNAALQRQMMMSGLVVWLNDTGDRTKDVGFKFPRGLMERRVPARDLMGALANPDMDEQRLQYLIHQNFRDLQVLDPKNNNLGIYTQKEAAEHNIQFELRMVHGLMIYELRIPLASSGRHPWNFADATTVGIGFATPEMDFSQFGGRRPMGAPAMDAGSSGGGMRGGGGRGGGMRGGGGMDGDMGGDMSGGMGGGMGGGFGQSKPINVWHTITMAKNN